MVYDRGGKLLLPTRAFLRNCAGDKERFRRGGGSGYGMSTSRGNGRANDVTYLRLEGPALRRAAARRRFAYRNLWGFDVHWNSSRRR